MKWDSLQIINTQLPCLNLEDPKSSKEQNRILEATRKFTKGSWAFSGLGLPDSSKATSVGSPGTPLCSPGTPSPPAPGQSHCTTVTCLHVQRPSASLDSEYSESRDWTSVSLIVFMRVTIISSDSLNSIIGSEIIPILHFRTLRLIERLSNLPKFIQFVSEQVWIPIQDRLTSDFKVSITSPSLSVFCFPFLPSLPSLPSLLSLPSFPSLFNN